MKYMKHPLKLKPDCFIIYAETNDLRSNQNAESMARNIVENANTVKLIQGKALISSIVLRRDNLNGKSRQLNIFLKKFGMGILPM